ncbi:MAG: aminopeptidase P family protein [Planctomycetes bacterium]|nr:aminopeptidase P family protein [Planctomycetota bacterium]
MADIERRLRKLRALLRREKLDALIVSNEHNVRYLSGFTGDDSVLLVAREAAVLVTDSRYTEQAGKEVFPYGLEVVERKKSIAEALGVLVGKYGAAGVGFEGCNATVDFHKHLTDAMKRVALRPTMRLVEGLREIKDASEVKTVRRAVRAAEEGLRSTLPSIRPGVTEQDIAAELEYQMRKQGADASAFPIIVAGGERASLPHARPTKRRIRPGEAVLIDWGARLEFYNSDLTRVFFLGTIPSDWKKRYEIVLQAQRAALKVIRKGVMTKTVDRAARDVFKKRRLAKRFGHGLGHGVGLEVHEAPGVNRSSESKLKPGMIFTVEPGIYFPEWGGIRIEDMVLVKRTGVEVLTNFEKQFNQVVI